MDKKPLSPCAVSTQTVSGSSDSPAKSLAASEFLQVPAGTDLSVPRCTGITNELPHHYKKLTFAKTAATTCPAELPHLHSMFFRGQFLAQTGELAGEVVEVVLKIGVAVGRDSIAVAGVARVQPQCGLPAIGHPIAVGVERGGPAHLKDDGGRACSRIDALP